MCILNYILLLGIIIFFVKYRTHLNYFLVFSILLVYTQKHNNTIPPKICVNQAHFQSVIFYGILKTNDYLEPMVSTIHKKNINHKKWSDISQNH